MWVKGRPSRCGCYWLSLQSKYIKDALPVVVFAKIYDVRLTSGVEVRWVEIPEKKSQMTLSVLRHCVAYQDLIRPTAMARTD